MAPDRLSASVRHKDVDVSVSATGKRALQTLVILVLIVALALLVWSLMPSAEPSKATAAVNAAGTVDK